MNKTAIFLLIITAFFVSCIQCRVYAGGSDAIYFGSIELRVGMEQDLVKARLSEQFSLVDLKGGSWFVRTKDGPPFTILGSVIFLDGKLYAVQRSWSPEDQQKGFELARNLFRIISQFVKEGNDVCILSSGEFGDPQNEGKDAVITCGKKSIRLSLIENKDGRFVNLDESLRKK